MSVSIPSLSRWQQWHPELRVETLSLIASVFFSLASNGLFWKSSLAGRSLELPTTWLFIAATFVVITALHFILLCLLLNRWTARPLLAFLIVATAFAAYYMYAYTVFLDASMLRNVLHTDSREAGELFSRGMILPLLLYAALPLLLLSRIRIRRDRFGRALLIRLLGIAAAGLVGVAALLLIFQDFSALMRNQKEIRYLITPGNYLYSLAVVLKGDADTAVKTRLPVGEDAVKSERWQQRRKPALFVIVVGETARAANWGLSGAARQTTPELARLEVVNFPLAKSCGTNTEVSVPCMFSVYGRRNHDEQKIRRSESLLNILERTGMKVIWRDNQAGCKGACTGVELQKLDKQNQAGLCDGEQCFDEILLHGLETVLAQANGDLVLVLHQLGNHGPAYYKRFPPAFRRFEPVCETADLGKCSREAIVNAYDNALLYTDHFLAQTIALLKRQEEKFDTALIYASDHGESLGENGLFLHGLPYSIAPKEQTEVPLLMWFSPGYIKDFSLDMDCLRQRASKPASHDNLFHSVLGLLDIKTSVYEASLDVAGQCRR